MPEPAEVQKIGVADPGKIGATVRPIYGERCPIMYHLFETEMKGISALNGEALRYFSFGSFLTSIVVSIVLDYAFSGQQLSELGNILLHKVSWFIGVLALMCFAAGGWAIWTKYSMIDQIKKETRQSSATQV